MIGTAVRRVRGRAGRSGDSGRRAGRDATRRQHGAGTSSRVERRRLVARRRARTALVLAAAFGVVVLVTQLPVHAILKQRADEARTAATVRRLARQNRFLSSQAAALTNPSTVQALAHSEFDYVHPGQKAYDVVPPSGGASVGSTGTGHVQLGQPVIAPGSAASAAAIGALGASIGDSSGGGLPSTGSTGGGQSATGAGTAPSGGFWTRMVHTFEFWR